MQKISNIDEFKDFQNQTGDQIRQDLQNSGSKFVEKLMSEIFEKLPNPEVENLMKYSRLMEMYREICLLKQNPTLDDDLDWKLKPGI